MRKIRYNSPVVLTFALLSLLTLLLDKLTGGWTNSCLFSVYRAPLNDPLTYVRFIGHVLGHAGYSHYIGNMLLILLVGPPLEEKYGSGRLLLCILFTAAVTGLVQFFFFPGTALLGASGIVYMMIIMLSFSGIGDGGIPLTLILVVVLYIGGEAVKLVLVRDNISQLTHIVGGLCGVLIGFMNLKTARTRRRRRIDRDDTGII